VTLVYDRTAVRGGLAGHRKHWQIYYQKGVLTKVLPKCPLPNPSAGDVPCWKNIVRTADRDLQVRVLINSDPKIATRR
jgi:hypothetical protein